MSDSSLIAHRSSLLPVPAPRCAISIRLATPADIPFIDELQKKHQKMLGWTPRKTIEGKIAAGHVLVAEEATERRSDGATQGKSFLRVVFFVFQSANEALEDSVYFLE